MGLIRLLLAISVVIAHSSSIFGFSLVGGQVAVQAFYIISGFYMSLILNEKYIGINNSYKLFITNRLLRLYPIYWIVLLLTIIFSLALIIYTKGDKLGDFEIYSNYFNKISILSFIFLIFTNLFLFLQDTVMFLGLNITNGSLFFTTDYTSTSPMLYQFLFIPQAWTIGIEIAFYLIAPFLVRKKLKFVLLLISLSILLRIILSYNGLMADPWSYRFFPTELVFFLLGIVAYRLYKKFENAPIKSSYLVTNFGVIICFTLLYSFWISEWKYYIYLFLFFISLPFIFILTKKWKRDSFIGELSYPIYISHLFVLSCLGALKVTKIVNLGLLLSITTIIFAIVLNELVSKRIEKVRQKRIIKNL